MSLPRPKDYSHSSNTLLSKNKKIYSKSTKSKSPVIRRGRLTYLRLKRLRGKPRTIATGFAMGVFAGCFPFFGIQTLLGIVLAAAFRGSKVAAIAGTWISNPITYLPIYVFNYKVGKFLLGVEDSLILPLDKESLSSLANFKELGLSFVLVLLVGCLVVGFIAACITYFYSLAILERLRDRRKREQRKRYLN